MHLCVGGTEEGKRRKGSPSLLPGSAADAFAILSGRHDQNPREKEDLEAGPHMKAGLCMCVCVLLVLEEVFMWVCGISSNVILSIWDCWCVGVFYLCPKNRRCEQDVLPSHFVF